MDKYYTPKPEEFHIGFECDLLGSKLVIENEHDFGLIINEPVRVKYLDKENIEALGWVLGTEVNTWTVRYVKGGYDLTVWFHEDFITLSISNELDNIIFCGKIKNKSELNRLMEQLTITKP